MPLAMRYNQHLNVVASRGRASACRPSVAQSSVVCLSVAQLSVVCFSVAQLSVVCLSVVQGSVHARTAFGRGAGGGGGLHVAAHSRTCTRLLLVSATTMRPSLSMAMPPQGWSNCPSPEPSLPIVRTWAPLL